MIATMTRFFKVRRSDTDKRLHNDSQDRRLDAEKHASTSGTSIYGVENAEGHHHRRARKNEQQSGNEAACRAVQQPADIDRELLRFRTRQGACSN